MDYRVLGRKAYKEWLKKDKFTVTKSLLSGMTKEDENNFREGILEARESAGLRRERHEEITYKEVMKNIKLYAN